MLLHRYVIREFFPPFIIGLAVFTFLLVARQLVLVMDLFLNRGVELGILLKMSGLILPMFLPLSIPMAALLAALLAYGRLSEDGEITALRSAGLSLFRYSWPNLALGLVLSLLLVYFNLNLAPRAAMEFKNIYSAVARQNPLALFSAKVVNNFGEYQIYVEKMDRRKNKISGVTIYRLNPESGPTRILAPEGEVSSSLSEGLTLELREGTIHQPSQDKESQYTITKFNKFILRVPAQADSVKEAATAREMTYSELKAKAQDAIWKNIDPAAWKTEIQMRFSVAFAPFIFVLLGTILGLSFKRNIKSAGIGMSLIVILFYYGLMIFMTSLSSQGAFSPLILAWVPNLLALGVGSGLWVKAR